MNMKKILAFALCLVLVAGLSIAGTIAWLMDETGVITNTFTVGNIDITLTETTGATYKMIPGATDEKNPKVTVEAGSEACWVFVKVTKENNVDKFLTYAINDSKWTPLGDEYPGVYYLDQADLSSATVDAEYYVIKDNTVSFKNTVTKEDMDGLTEATYPKLSFQAYAIQKTGFDNVTNAWIEVSK